MKSTVHDAPSLHLPSFRRKIRRLPYASAVRGATSRDATFPSPHAQAQSAGFSPNPMNAHGVLSAKPVAASAARVGRRSTTGQKSVGINRFAGDAKAFKARASGRRAAQPVALRVVAEKVVGIDLGTTNSAVRARGDRACALPDAHVSASRRFFSPPQPRPQGFSERSGRGAWERPVRSRGLEPSRRPPHDLTRSFDVRAARARGSRALGGACASSSIRSPMVPSRRRRLILG